MSLRDILTWPDPRLSTVCAPVDEVTPEVDTLIDDMFETVKAAGSPALAAPQVGVTQRVFVLNVIPSAYDPCPEVCINPEIVETRDNTVTTLESSLSLPGIEVSVTRPAWIWMVWLRQRGMRQIRAFEGEEAVWVQQQLDQLGGKTILDHLPPDERAAVLASYVVP